MDKAIRTYISVLKAEVQHLKSKLEPHDTGHIHTTIGTLEHRIRELENGQEKSAHRALLQIYTKGSPKKTSIGKSKNSRPLNKHSLDKKKYRGQGK